MSWLAERGTAFGDRFEFGTLFLFGQYRHVFEVTVLVTTMVAGSRC